MKKLIGKKLSGLTLLLFVLMGAALANALVPTPVPPPTPLTAEAVRVPVFLLLRACGGSGTNLTASTWTDVALCHTAASNAATITVASGSYTVTTNTAITKFVKIVCASVCTLTDNVTNLSDLITITESTAGSTRLEGFTFVQGTGVHQNPNGVIRMVRTSGGKPILVTDNTFTMGVNGDAIIAQVNRGVIWDNTITASWGGAPSSCGNNVAFVRQKLIGEGAVWLEGPFYGTDDTDGQHNLYIETNTLNNAFEGIDADANARNVTRYNMIINSGVVGHGADTGLDESHRYIDLYNNTFVWDTTIRCAPDLPASVNSFIYLRGAPALIHSNVIPNVSSMAWGDKNEVNMTNEQLRRNAGLFPCWNQGYPSPYQVGQGYTAPITEAGSSGVFQGLEGVYLWSNTGAGNYGSPALPDYSPNECGGGAPLVSTYIQSGRDYFLATAKPAYTPYPYPHPLTFGTTYYVNKSGSNSNSCANAQSAVPADAKLTITAGISCLSAGDTLLIGAGTYSELLDYTYGAAGTPVGTSFADAITIGANSGAEGLVILTYTGGDHILGLATDAYPTFRSFYWIFNDLVFDGAGVVHFPVGGLGTNHLRFQNVEFKNAVDSGFLNGGNFLELLNVSSHDNGDCAGDHGLYMSGADNLIDGGSYYNNYGYGIQMYGGSGATSRNIVRNTRIYHNNYGVGGGCPTHTDGSAGGIILTSGSDNTAYNNLIYDNLRIGIAVGESGGGDSNKILFNTIYGNDYGYYIGVGSTGAQVKNNIIYGNVTVTAGNDGSGSSISSNLSTDPLFVNEGAADFNLANPGSPAIGAGVAIPGITTDFAGTTRPNPPAIGALDVTTAPSLGTYYVNKSGNDANSCMTAQSPTDTNAKLTIAAGVSCLSPSSTLLIGNGVYTEAMRNTIPSGVSGSYTFIKAENLGQVTLRPSSGASVIVFTGTGTNQYIVIDGIVVDGVSSTGSPVLVSKDPGGFAHHLIFQNGATLNGVAADGFKIGKPGNGPAHHDNQITTWETYNNGLNGLFINGAETTTVDGLYAHNNAGNGAQIYDATAAENDDNVVRNSRFITNGTAGADSSFVVASGTSNLVYNNVISGGTRYGVLVFSNAVSTGLYFNSIYAAPLDCINITAAAGNTGNILRNNICYQNGSDTINDGGTSTITSNNSLGANPPFINAPAQNFHLGFSSPSPVIAQGVLVAGIGNDADGIARTNPPDIGAFQYAAPAPGFISSATPNSGVRTATGLNVVLGGIGTSWINGASVCSFSGTGITVNSTTVTSASAATCNITIAANATLGTRTISVNTNGGIATLVDGFTVLTAPAITSVTPSSGVRSQTINVGLVGSNTGWVQGTSAGSFSGTGVTVNSTTVSSATAATLNISISPTATLGLRNVIMTTAGSTATLTNGFTVNQVPTKLGYTTQPPTSVNSGATLSNVVVAVQFSDGSTSTTSTNGVTISLCSGTGTLTGTVTRNAVAGLATFNNLVITSVSGGSNYALCASASGLTGATSNTFTVVGLGPATKVAFTTQPPTVINSGAAIPIVRVSVQFANSTTDTSSTASVTVSICGGSPAGTLAGTLTRAAVAGVAAFNDLSITSGVGGAGYTLCAVSAPLTSAISNSFTVNVPVEQPTKLGFTVQPTTTATGAPMSTVVVAVQFASGATDTTASNSIAITLCSGTGTLSGTLTRAALNGLASFTNLSVNATTTGANFALCATTAGLTSATSDNFTVTVPPPAPTKLGVTTQPPTSVLSGATLSSVNIAVQFSNGTTDTSSTSTVTIGICNGSPAGTLGGTLAKPAVAGIANFNDLTVTTTLGGAGYSLCAVATSLTGVTTNSFTVNVPASTCVTNPLIVTKLSWPTGQTGSRSLGWNSSSFSIAGISFTYPGTALFTDTRGCQTTVRKN